MARIDGPSSASAYPAIDTPEKAQPEKNTEHAETMESPIGSDVAGKVLAQSVTSSTTARPPLTDPTEKSVVLMRFSQAGHTGEVSRSGTSAPAGGPPPLQKSTLVGMRLGTNYHGEEVRITREVGSSQGYANKFQAIAAARFGKAEPAAVVQGTDGKWHALETTANFYRGMAAADTNTLAVQGLASSTDIENARQKYIALLKEIDQPHSGADRDELVNQLQQTQAHLAALLFDVTDSDINLDSKHLVPGKINLVPPGDLPAGASGVTKTVPKPGDSFGNRTIVLELDINKLKDPAGAMGTLFHEATHLQDLEFAQSWVRKFEQQTKQKFVESDPSKFEDWLLQQVGKGGLSKADKELVMSEIHGPLAIPEARSHVHAALAALQGHAPDVATRELVNYVVDIKNNAYGNLIDDGKVTNGAAVKSALTHEIQAAYRQMSPDMQRQLEAAIAAARKQNPDAWIAKITLSK
jgi:hypothetical protein